MISTATRVPANTATEVNLRIHQELEDRLSYLSLNPSEIDERLDELDDEWDIERTIEANASTLAFAGTVLGATIDKRWLWLPALVTGFLFQHAVQGWCPPVPILRRFGYRTADEINRECYALKALRGDFTDVNSADGASALRATAS